VNDLITVLRQATPSVGVRAWHNHRSEPFGGVSAHKTIEIAWLDGGGRPPEYTVLSRPLVVTPASVVVVPAEAEHLTMIAPGARAKVLALHPSVVEEMADAMGVGPELEPSVANQDGRLLRLCNHIFEEAVVQAMGHDLVLEALTEALAVELLRADGARPPKPTPRVADIRIRRAIAFVDASYAEPLSLDAIAKVAGMSRYHFGRVFEAQVGKSPYRYLVDVRIARASALLRTGRVSVTEAALSVGFNDLGRFGRAFRARHGVTPSEALAANRRKSGPAIVPLSGSLSGALPGMQGTARLA
jgi:AraC-like DNA-binding protein